MRIATTLLALLLASTPARAQHPDMPGGHGHHHGQDSAFAAMQMRGRSVMGVDQYASAHHFDSLGNGGRITLQSNDADSAAIGAIRRHLRSITRAFAAGDFSSPMAVHDRTVPGTTVMAARRATLRYEYHDVPRGGEVRIITHDAKALSAVHEFLAFQRGEHRAGGTH